MATTTLDGSMPPQNGPSGRRPVGRIVPAIPHGFGPSRSAKPESKRSAESERPTSTEVPAEAVAEAMTKTGTSVASDTGLPVHEAVEQNETDPNPVQPFANGVSELAATAQSLASEVKEAATELPESTTVHLESQPHPEKEVADESQIPTEHRADSTAAPIPIMLNHASYPQRAADNLPPAIYTQQTSRRPSYPLQPAHQTRQPEASSHQARSSNHSIVFGGYRESDDASPSQAPSQQQARQTPPPSFHGRQPNSAPLPTAVNGYNTSDSHSFHLQPAGYVSQPREFHGYGPQHQPRPQYPPTRYGPPRRQFENFSPRHQIGMMPPPGQMYNQLPQPFVPRAAEQNANGPKAIHPDLMREGMQQEHRHRQHSLTPSDGQIQMEPRLPHPEESAVIARYLCSQFGSPDFADYLLQLSHSIYQFPPTILPAHGLILARSPKLRSLMAMPKSASQNGLKVLNVPISDRFLNVDGALMRAIMRLYGETLPDRADIVRLSAPFAQLEGGSIEAAQMRFALAFAAAGHFLQIDEIISHALLLVGHMLSWSTITKALAFALDGGLSTAFTQFEAPSKDRESNSSSFDGMPLKMDSPTSAPAYGFYSDRLLSHIMSFFVHSVPLGFKFSPTAPQLNDPPRLPAEADPKHMRSTSRLSQIRFGDMTLEDPSTSDPITQIISSIFVTLPFPLLRSAFDSPALAERLGPPNVAELLRVVVQEREHRRLRATTHRIEGGQAEEGVWRAVRWVETVEPTDRNPMGVRVTRSLAGNSIPPSTPPSDLSDKS